MLKQILTNTFYFCLFCLYGPCVLPGENIFQLIEAELRSSHIPRDSCLSLGCDNANVMMGQRSVCLLFPFSSSLKPSTVSLPDSITLGSHNIPISDSARNLGFILDSKLSMKKHVIKICQTVYFELKRMSSICRFLTEDATKTCYFLYPLTA